MARKSYRVERKTEDIGFDIEFTFNGQQKTASFDCVSSLPVGMVLDFATIGMGDDNDPQAGAKAMEKVEELFRVAIVPEQYDKWVKLINDPKVAIDIQLYTQIASDLAGEYTGGRPTGASLDSSPQDQSSGQDSTAGASVVPLTYSRLEPVPVTTSSSIG